MKISILLAHENNPHEGVVRPFINWSKELSKALYFSKDHKIYLIARAIEVSVKKNG